MGAIFIKRDLRGLGGNPHERLHQDRVIIHYIRSAPEAEAFGHALRSRSVGFAETLPRLCERISLQGKPI